MSFDHDHCTYKCKGKLYNCSVDPAVDPDIAGIGVRNLPVSWLNQLPTWSRCWSRSQGYHCICGNFSLNHWSYSFWLLCEGPARHLYQRTGWFIRWESKSLISKALVPWGPWKEWKEWKARGGPREIHPDTQRSAACYWAGPINYWVPKMRYFSLLFHSGHGPYLVLLHNPPLNLAFVTKVVWKWLPPVRTARLTRE